MRRSRAAFVVALAVLCATSCQTAEPVEASRDDCLRAMAREYTAYMADHNCRSVLGADYCTALLTGIDVRAERGLASEKIERVYYQALRVVRQPRQRGRPGRRGFSWWRSRCDGQAVRTIAGSLFGVGTVG